MIVCKYKFDKSIYSNLIPVFNDGYNGYTVSDVTEGNIVTRTIECDTLPTTMRFGEQAGQYEDSKIGAKAKSLKEVLYADISNVTDGNYMFGGCINLTKINTEGWNNNNLMLIHHMFFCCKSLATLDVTGLVSDMVVNVGFAFYYCAALYNLTGLESWDISNVTSMNAMFQNCIKLTSLDVSNWDTSNVTRMSSMFQGCSSLTSLDVSNFNTSEVTNMWGMFYGCNNLTSLDVSNWNTTNVTSMSNMFYGCNNLTSLDVSNWNTTNVTSMSNMFYSCKKLTSLDVSNWNTSNVTGMQQMFNRCYNLTTLDVSNFNTSKVTNMYAMFAECTNLTSLDVSNFNTSKVTTMEKIMWYNEALTVINFNNIILYDNITINSMFTQTLNIEKIYINVPNTLNKIISQIPDRTEKETGELVTTLELDDEITTNLNAKNWIVKKLVAQYRYDANTYENLIPEFNTEFSSDKYEVNDSVSEIIIDNIKWEEGAISNSNGNEVSDNTAHRSINFLNIFPNVTYYLNQPLNVIWYDANKNFIKIDLWHNTSTNYIVSPSNAKFIRVYQNNAREGAIISAKLITRSIESKNGDLPTLMILGYNGNDTYNHEYDGQGMSLLKVYDMNTTELTTAYRMFKYCKRVEEINCSNWNTSKIVDMRGMFVYCQLLTTLDVSSFNTSNVTGMQSMFSTCNKLTSLDVSNFNTSNVTNMSYMFNNCNNLTSLDVSNWNTSKVTGMQSMFSTCNKLTSLDVSNFNTSKVTDMSWMFNGCNSLTSLDVSNWNTSKVTNMGSVFNNCNSLTSLDVSNWNTSKVTNMNSIFRDCYKLTQLDLSRWNNINTADIGFIIKSAGVKNIKLNFNKVSNISAICAYCTNLEVLDLGMLDLTNLTNNFTDSFLGATSLKQLKYDNKEGMNKISELLLDRTDKEQGIMFTSVDISTIPSETISTLQSKNWTIVSSNTLTKVAEYVYDSKIWRSMIPEFNNEFVDYFIDDVENENGLVTRTISSMGGLPTLMRFGVTPINNNENVTNRELSLLEILDINTNEMTTGYCMFFKCNNLSSINTENFNTSNITSMQSMFRGTNLTSLDVSNFNTSNVTTMRYMFNGCINLTSLDVSNFDTSKVTNMASMFNGCINLTSLDLSNFNTSNVTDMSWMFDNCNKLASLDVSNFNTSKLTSTERLSNRWWYPTHSIGMLYCDKDTINKLIPLLKGNGTPTIYVKDVKPNELTSVNGVEFKEYKENSYMINLSSPLLDGDRIEVVDGKLCHYHKMGKVVLDGSEVWSRENSNTNIRYRFYTTKLSNNEYQNKTIPICDTLNSGIPSDYSSYSKDCIVLARSFLAIAISTNKLPEPKGVKGFKQWLSENPTTVIYQLANPYYEDITPLQSDIVLETYLECNLDIYTKLPIKANVSYITNVPSLSTLSMRATEMKESDNIIANLTNMLDNEINE